MHPGELLLEEFMNPPGLSTGKVAKAIGVPTTRVETIVSGEVAITADTALRLSRLFGMTPQFWTNAQSAYGSEKAALKIGKMIDRIRPIGKSA